MYAEMVEIIIIPVHGELNDVAKLSERYSAREMQTTPNHRTYTAQGNRYRVQRNHRRPEMD